jgi:hypothetical protein
MGDFIKEKVAKLVSEQTKSLRRSKRWNGRKSKSDTKKVSKKSSKIGKKVPPIPLTSSTLSMTGYSTSESLDAIASIDELGAEDETESVYCSTYSFKGVRCDIHESSSLSCVI